MMDCDIHHRVLKLRDVALGLKKTVKVNSSLAAASYDCAMDSLLALYSECSQASSLERDKNVGRFLGKYTAVVVAVNELRLTADDFEKKSVIGRGHFGEVHVVQEKSTGDTYAMKIMQKSHILQQADAAFFSEERDIMAWANSPWLTSLHYAFQDQSSLYLVMDFHPGGDLLTIMERKEEGGMSEVEARFYLSEIAAGLHDLHQLGFVHRDVKPENVLITRSGHIKLVDFGSAARLGDDGRVVESRLPVGTPEYIAPEVLTSLDKSADYGVCCDWWSLGIIAYELLYESTPFEDESTSKMYGNIMSYKTKLSFPSEPITSGEVKSLIKSLLTDPKQRLSFEQLKKHKFFSNVAWDHLISVVPPYIPVVSSVDDTSNFDVFDSEKDDLRKVDLSSKNHRNFSGNNLPFVGFTYTRYEDPSRDEQNGFSNTTEVDHGAVTELQWSLERIQRELLEMKERKSSLERECVIYQSQLDDFHRKLEIEKSERRQSDSKALRLLEEVREHGRVVKELREQEANATEGDLKAVIEQLEQERSAESKRSRRLKEELKKSQSEREQALKKLVETKSRLAEVKEANRKDVTALQNKLAKATKNSLTKTSEMQDRLLEAQERCVVVSKKLQDTEEAKMKAEYKIKQMQLQVQTSVTAEDPADLKSQLESLQLAHDELVKELEDLLKTTRDRNKELSVQLETANTRNHELESNEMKLTNKLQALKLEVDQFHQLLEDNEKISEKLLAKTQETHQQKQIISELKSSQKALEAKMAELEEIQDATSHIKDNQHAVFSMHAVELAQQEAEVSKLESQLTAIEAAKKETESQLTETRRRSTQEEQRHREEIKSLQSQLSEATNIAIQQGEKLREVRRTKRELDQENMDLKTALRKAERESGSSEKKYSSACEELKALETTKEKLTTLERELKSLHAENKVLEHKVKMKDHEKEEVMLSKRGLESAVSSNKKELEAQELNTALLQRTIKSLEDELVDARTVSEETRDRETQWLAIKETISGDLECAESKIDDAYSSIEKEKNARSSAELQLKNVTESLEKTMLAHSEEVREIQEELNTQRQLASKYSDKVSELEKELRLKQLSHKEAQKGLDLEKALSSKLYDDMHSLKREHGKMKAAHMKLLSEVQERELQLAQVTQAQQKMLEQQRSASRIHQIDRTKLEVTIDQQAKLIDYLHGPSGPQSTTKRKKGFKFGRKARDPAKEIAEWNKLKGILRKPGKGSVAKSSSSNVSLVSIQTPKSTSTSSLDQNQSYLLNTSTPFLSSASSTSAVPLNAYLGSSPRLEESISTPQIMHTPLSADTAKKSSNTVSGPGDKNRLEMMSGVTTYFSVSVPDEDKPPSKGLPSSTSVSIPVKDEPPSKGLPSSTSVSIPVKDEPPSKGLPSSTSVSIPDKDEPPSKVSPVKRAVVGKKRKTNESGVSSQPGSDDGVSTTSLTKKLPTMQHNIPHKFHLKTSGLHKTHTCSACKQVIKPLQKLTKCQYCHVTCHPQCIDSLPNSCGLPSELAEQVQPPAKKRSLDTARVSEKSQNKKRSNKSQKEAVTKEKESDLTDDGGATADIKKGATIYTGIFDPNKVIRNEKVTVIRGSMKTVGWLLLTEDSLCLYDRDPRGLTRKPIHSFVFNTSGCVFLLLPNVTKGSTLSPGKHFELAFGIEKHSMSGVEQTIFYAETVKSKIDWVEDIGKALSIFSQHTSSRNLARGDVMSPPRSQGRELKAVAITPVKSSVNSTSPSSLKRKSATPASSRRAKRTKK